MEAVYPGLKLVAAYIVLMLCVGLLLSCTEFIKKKYRFTFKNLCLLWTVHTIDLGLRVLVYILAIPLILLLFVLQPIMVLACLIAIILLIIFCVGLFFEEPIVGNPPSSTEAIWALITIVGCLIIWWLAVKVFKSEDALFDRYANFFVEKIHQPMQHRVQEILQNMED